MSYRNPADIQTFIDFLKFEKRYSIHTTRAYHDDLCQFLDYLDVQYDSPSLNEINSSLIKSWLAVLKAGGMENKSLNRKISVLKSFFKFQVSSGVLEKTPMVGIVSPKTRRRLPVYVNQPEMKTLLEHVEFSGGWQGLTERLSIEIFYYTGMRLSELVHLKVSHVNYSGHSLKVLGKGNKERIIPVSTSLLDNVRAYQNRKGEMLGPNFDREYLLLTPRGKKLYSKYLYRIVHKYLGFVTTIESKSPHILRHSFATHLMNNGANLNAVKELLGHSSLAATQVYTHNTITKLQEVHKKAHPKG